MPQLGQVGPEGQIRPAVIHDVHSDVCVSLSVFVGANDLLNSDAAVLRVTSVCQDQEGKAPRTWHWNEHQIASGKPSH